LPVLLTRFRREGDDALPPGAFSQFGARRRTLKYVELVPWCNELLEGWIVPKRLQHGICVRVDPRPAKGDSGGDGLSIEPHGLVEVSLRRINGTLPEKLGSKEEGSIHLLQPFQLLADNLAVMTANSEGPEGSPVLEVLRSLPDQSRKNQRGLIKLFGQDQ